MSNDEKNNGGDEAAGVLAAVVAVPVVIGGIWAARGNWYGVLAPYGIATEDTTTTRSGYGYGRGNDPWGRTTNWDGSSAAETVYGSGHFHINWFGWAVLAGFVVFLVALGVLAFSGLSWSRWHSAGGTRAIPRIWVPAGAYTAGFAAFLLVMALIGRRESTAGHAIVGILALTAAAVAGVAVMGYCTVPAQRFRGVQAYAARADQVLGHGHPGALRVRTPVFSGWNGPDDEHSWPAQLVCLTGPGWQHKPAETAELNRYAREFGWPPYAWRYDPMRKRITGTARPDVHHADTTDTESIGG
ncbi:hypothetical protein QMY57_25805 (plasmid) [Mycobacteroides abscessus subsp. abscessus]|uniref:hypothetical protein n=1 Tax=Mycobacteroides abscessus TaxID=36809 RepID=UPI001878CF7C|nr:hypothetical protein [Mycobacteroides abscessus]